MSRIGAKPVAVPKGVTVTFNDSKVTAKGPKGEMSLALPDRITARIDAEQVALSRPDNSPDSKRLHGTSRSLLASMIKGVAEGFSKELEIEGVGYKAECRGTKLVITVGFSHPIEYEAPQGVNLAVKSNVISVTGVNKQQVGEVAAHIRSVRPPEPYKGKGIRLKGEHVKRKAGKTVA